MLNIENLNYAIGLRIDLDEHGDWECREAIEYQTDFSNQPEMFYRFELDNDDLILFIHFCCKLFKEL